MIPENFIEKWRKNAQWQTPSQVEQDLIISRALVDLYNDPYISKALVFMGGTALNKLFLKPPSRYSEDLDFVQKNPEPIGPKLIYKYEAINKLPAKLKIEINTTEHFQVLPLRSEEFNVESDWWSGNAQISTYEIDELYQSPKISIENLHASGSFPAHSSLRAKRGNLTFHRQDSA